MAREWRVHRSKWHELPQSIEKLYFLKSEGIATGIKDLSSAGYTRSFLNWILTAVQRWKPTISDMDAVYC